MDAFEAKLVIDALASGVDPVAGEVMLNDSVLLQPEVIRALFIASRALEKMAASTSVNKEQLAKAGQSWTEDEEVQLLAAFDGGETIKQIAANHGRSCGAITSRLARLGRIQPD